jgi:hypothetical protein
MVPTTSTRRARLVQFSATAWHCIYNFYSFWPASPISNISLLLRRNAELAQISLRRLENLHANTLGLFGGKLLIAMQVNHRGIEAPMA